MTLDEAIKSFDKTAKELESHVSGAVMVQLAITACTLIKNRVIEDGKKADGSQFTPYSTKAMLIGCKSFHKKATCQQVLGSKEKRKKLEWRTIGGSSGFSSFLSVSAGTSSGMAGGGGGVRLAILPGGYKQLRDLQGYPTDHVNFSISNAMWNNILVRKKGDPGLLSTDSDHRNGIAIIGPREDLQKKKLAGNVKRRGDILDLSNDEQEYLKFHYGLSALQVFKNNGLA